MEQVQRRYVTFKSDSLDIVIISWATEVITNCVCLPVSDNSIVSPFFDLSKNINQYYPIVDNNIVIGFRRRELFEKSIVLETEDSIIRGLRSFENFITEARIMVMLDKDHIKLKYDSAFFDPISQQENIDRLNLAKDRVYNLYVTRNGDPFTIFAQTEIALEPFTQGLTVTIPYNGPKDISVYVVAKD